MMMKKMNDRPQRNMMSSVPRGVTRSSDQKTNQSTGRDVRTHPGIKNIDADLGNLNNTARHPSNSIYPPRQPPSAISKATTTASSSQSQPTLTAKQQKMALSVTSTKGYKRGTPTVTKTSQYMASDNTDTSSVDFPIDLVYTWVDGSDEEWMKIRRKVQPTQNNIPDDSLMDCRWRDFDELRLSIESALRFAPWIRTIFIISDFQRPYWFDESNPGKIRFVDHPILFQEFEEHLPTFNSHALESHLHRIPDLAEHFIYANDDTFFGQDVYPLDFFAVDGKFKVFLTVTDLETETSLKEYARQPPPKPVLSQPNSKLNPKLVHTEPSPSLEKLDILPYFTSQAVTNSVMDQVFGPSPAARKRLKHQMKAFRRSIFEWCWDHELIQLYLFNTSSTRFRSLGDIDATTLVSHVGLKLGEAVPASISSKYYGVEDHTDIQKLFYHLFKFRPTPKLYCINDNLSTPSDEFLQTIRVGFEKYLPHKYL